MLDIKFGENRKKIKNPKLAEFSGKHVEKPKKEKKEEWLQQ